ncbi:MAG: hypothetical protein ACFFA8_07575 [Promethearchaeota archaeon]
MQVMKMLKKIIFFTIAIALLLSGFTLSIMTILPDTASKPCLLGYYAHCSFAPISSIILFTFGLLGLFLLIKLVKSGKKNK